MENRHAYLIMIHNNLPQFEILLQCLDYEKNDIYVHVDKKLKEFTPEKYKKIIKKGNLFILPKRINIKWGGFTQIECELELLKEATKRNHSYYHLISGADMPLKNQNDIYNFFENHYGMEFIHFDEKELRNEYRNRINKYYLFTGKKKSIIKKIINKLFLLLQFKKNRIDNNIVLGKGANWFTITDKLANYVLSYEKEIRKMYKYTLTADEMFLQTLVLNSEFKEKLYNQKFNDDYSSILYCIDWKRGNPYVYK
ncbi:MAG: beta-1,6-N-acetylglucosaminyltransferase, partial [Bacilli bacterium]|nr:beta-1,6-N-acetylglucosaminyltransferase [Bacilli bacterium]